MANRMVTCSMTSRDLERGRDPNMFGAIYLKMAGDTLSSDFT